MWTTRDYIRTQHLSKIRRDGALHMLLERIGKSILLPTLVVVAIFFANQTGAAEKVRRVIYNDDLETTIRGHGIPFSADHLEALYRRVENTGITTFALKVVEFDNKNAYVGNKMGIDWSEIDWSKYPENFDIYRQTTEFLRKIHDEGRPIFNICIDACRKMGIECFATFRMNDWHGRPLTLDNAANPDISYWLKKYPQYALTHQGKPIMLADYRHQAVRDYRLGVLKEIITDFEFDGVELDFMRSNRYFMLRELTDEEFEQLSPHLTDFVVRTRKFLDKLAKKKGQTHIPLGVRVPGSLAAARKRGMDVPAWIEQAKLDYIAPSLMQGTGYNIPVSEFVSLCEGTQCAVHPTIFCNASWSRLDVQVCNKEAYAAAAQNFYAAGADGISVFNHFCPSQVHYSTPGTLLFDREALTVIGSPESAARADHHYFFAKYNDTLPGIIAGQPGSEGSLAFQFGEDLAKTGPTGRQLEQFRFKVFNMVPGDEIEVALNGTTLPCSTSWRQRMISKRVGNFLPGDRYKPGGFKPYLGQLVPETDTTIALEVDGRPRREPGQRHIFTLLEADTSVATAALRQGENSLALKIKKRREGATQDWLMSEIEVVVVTR